MNRDGAVKWVVSGTWDEYMEAARVINQKTHKNHPVFETESNHLLWKRRIPP